MAGKTYLGIDAGTSVVKAAIFDENGDALAVQGQAARLMHDSGGIKGAVEQDFDVILATIRAVVADAIREAGHDAGVGRADRAGRRLLALRRELPARAPRPVWLDGRAGPLVDEWTKSGVLAAGVPDQRRDDVPRRAGRVPEVAGRERARDAGPRGHRGLLSRTASSAGSPAMRATDPSDARMPLGDGTGMGYSDRAGADGAHPPASTCWPRSWPRSRWRADRRAARAARAARRHPRDLAVRSTSPPAASAAASPSRARRATRCSSSAPRWAAWCTSTSWSPPATPPGSACPPASPASGCAPCRPWSAPRRWTGC